MALLRTVLVPLVLSSLSTSEASLRAPHHKGHKGHKGHHHKLAVQNATTLSATRAPQAPPKTVCQVTLPRHTITADSQADAFKWLDGVFDQREERAYKIPKNDSNIVKAAASQVGKELPIQCDEDSYGEIPQESAAKLFAHPMVQLSPGETFADLGSGLGRLVVDAALVGNVQRAIGVELSHTRSTLACSALSDVKEAMPATGKETSWRKQRHEAVVELREGNILDIEDDLMDKLNVVYVASLCFRPDLLTATAQKLDRSLPSGARVVSLREFDMTPEIKRMKYQGTLNLPMSWSVEGYAQGMYVYKVA